MHVYVLPYDRKLKIHSSIFPRGKHVRNTLLN